MRKYKTLTDIIAYLIIVLSLVSCRSAEQLIDKAIKKDPAILLPQADTITLTKIQIDSIEIRIGDTVIWDRIITEVEYDTIINYDLLTLQRKKTRQEIRKAAKIEKLRLKLEAKLAKQQQKYDKQIAKLQERLKSKETRQENRQESKEKRSNKFWIGLILGILLTLGITYALKRVFKLFR